MIEEILEKTSPLPAQSSHSAENKNLQSLEAYVETYVLGKTNFKRSKLETILGIIFGLFGAAWGVSWMDASAKAAIIFSEGLFREFAGNLFKFGIVTTVGADGLWIMLTLGKNIGSKPELGEKKTPLKNKLVRSMLSLLLSLTSIIAPVYSAFKYNAGVGQLLAIVIFVVKFGYSLFGYSTLIDQILLFWKRHFSKDKKEDLAVLTVKKRVLKNLNYLKQNPGLLSEFSSGQALIRYVFLTIPDQSTPEAPALLFKKHFKTFFQTLMALSIGLAAFTVDVFIIAEVLEKFFSIQGTLSFPLAIIAALPTFVVMTLSSCRTLDEWLNTFLLKKKGDSVFEQYYPTLNKLTRIFTFLLSCLAPTAAAYITYDTLIGKIDIALVWTAVIFMIASRNLFAYFSLNQLLSKSFVFFGKKGKSQKAERLDQSCRIAEFIERMVKMDGQDFKLLCNAFLLKGVATTPRRTMQERMENINLKR